METLYKYKKSITPRFFRKLFTQVPSISYVFHWHHLIGIISNFDTRGVYSMHSCAHSQFLAVKMQIKVAAGCIFDEMQTFDAQKMS